MGEAPASAPPAAPQAEPANLSPSAQGPACWHLSLRFLADALRSGLDPLAFLRYLGQLARCMRCT